MLEQDERVGRRGGNKGVGGVGVNQWSELWGMFFFGFATALFVANFGFGFNPLH